MANNQQFLEEFKKQMRDEDEQERRKTQSLAPIDLGKYLPEKLSYVPQHPVITENTEKSFESDKMLFGKRENTSVIRASQDAVIARSSQQMME